ncbi:MAG TPA: hypothetical protein PLN69_09430 [bacterium]|nr:hypothetical protein [bacterium]
MKTDRKKTITLPGNQDSGKRTVGARDSIRIVLLLMLIGLGFTMMGVYIVSLKFQIDCKHMRVDEIKKQNYKLDIQIGKLEAEVQGLKSFDRVESKLLAAGYKVAVPDKVVYINTDDSRGKAARAEGSDNSARAGMF